MDNKLHPLFCVGCNNSPMPLIHLKFGHEFAITFLLYIDKLTYHGPSLEVGLATLFVKEAPGGLRYIAHR